MAGICEVLNLNPSTTKELHLMITKKYNAFDNPKSLNMNLYAQQCRVVLDKLVGFIFTNIMEKY